MTTYPNVPDVPGVPPLPRNPGGEESDPSSVADVDSVAGFAASTPPQWGIFKDGVPVVTPDSVVAFDYKQNWALADYPIEKGGFESYDRVNTPFDARMRIASGGSEANRELLLNQVAAISDTVDLYDVVTPEHVYLNTSVAHYDYRRTSRNGVGLLTVDVWLVQIRVTASASFSQTKSPSGAGTVNGGTVQPVAPTPAQESAAEGVQ